MFCRAYNLTSWSQIFQSTTTHTICHSPNIYVGQTLSTTTRPTITQHNGYTKLMVHCLFIMLMALSLTQPLSLLILYAIIALLLSTNTLKPLLPTPSFIGSLLNGHFECTYTMKVQLRLSIGLHCCKCQPALLVCGLHFTCWDDSSAKSCLPCS